MHRNRVQGGKKVITMKNKRKNFTLVVVTKDYHTSDNFISKI